MVASWLKHLYSLGYQVELVLYHLYTCVPNTPSTSWYWYNRLHEKNSIQQLVVVHFRKVSPEMREKLQVPWGVPWNSREAAWGMIKEMHRIYFFLRVSILRYGKCILYIHVKCPLVTVSLVWLWSAYQILGSVSFGDWNGRSIFWQIKRNTAMI